MKSEEILDKVRKLIRNAEAPLMATKTALENAGWRNKGLYSETIISLALLRELIVELGLKEDEIQEGTNTKNRKLFP